MIIELNQLISDVSKDFVFDILIPYLNFEIPDN
jgi:hypothetical protein